MRNFRLIIIVVVALALWAYLYFGAPGSAYKSPGPVTEEPGDSPSDSSRLLENRSYGSYGECDEAAERMVQELKDQGVSVALASRSTLTQSTIYKVYYDDATGQISCSGERLVSEINKER